MSRPTSDYLAELSGRSVDSTCARSGALNVAQFKQFKKIKRDTTIEHRHSGTGGDIEGLELVESWTRRGFLRVTSQDESYKRRVKQSIARYARRCRRLGDRRLN